MAFCKPAIEIGGGMPIELKGENKHFSSCGNPLDRFGGFIGKVGFVPFPQEAKPCS